MREYVTIARQLLGVALLAVVVTAPATAAPFKVNEASVTTEPRLLDPEFNQATNALAWVDLDGKLWVAQVDRQTGMIVPPDGRGTLVDADAMTSNDIAFVYNGPEWISTSRGEELVYTKFEPGLPHIAANARLAAAARDAGGNWTVRFLGPPSASRYSPYASSNAGDPQPTISYIDESENHYWRDLDSPSSETFVGKFEQTISLRFSRGQRSIPLVGRAADGQSQVFRLWLDSGVREQLTFDSGHAMVYSASWMWSAPEYGGEMLLGVLAQRNREFRVYRKLSETDPAWSLIHTVKAPNRGSFGSMEPFTYKGKSYVYMSWAPAGSDFGTAIFVSNIDPSAPLARRITPADSGYSRRDPEIFFTDAGPRIYFTRYGSNSSSCPFCNPEGLWMADPGLDF